MNGYKLLSESYKKAAEEGKISKEEAAKHSRVYEFLASCDLDDLFILYDSSAFNEIAKSYIRIAARELIEEGAIDEEQGRAIRNRFSLLFDEKTANEVYEI